MRITAGKEFHLSLKVILYIFVAKNNYIHFLRRCQERMTERMTPLFGKALLFIFFFDRAATVKYGRQ